ncbi:MAG: phospholipase A [Treponema sp.]|nr:phospholipase A [Treponema sp.]
MFALFCAVLLLSAPSRVFPQFAPLAVSGWDFDGDFDGDFIDVKFLPFSWDFASHEDRDAREALLQIMFRKDIVRNISPLKLSAGVTFTMQAWWQIFSPSVPFRDTNYAPEFYITLPFGEADEPDRFFQGVNISWAHRSNGRDGPFSRAWDRFCFALPLSIKGVQLYPRVWYTVVKNDTHADMVNYLGLFDFTAVYRYNKHMFALYTRTNVDFGDFKGALQGSYSYPLFGSKFFLYLYYFSGYGESLIDVTIPVNKLGVGVVLNW